MGRTGCLRCVVPSLVSSAALAMALAIAPSGAAANPPRSPRQGDRTRTRQARPRGQAARHARGQADGQAGRRAKPLAAGEVTTISGSIPGLGVTMSLQHFVLGNGLRVYVLEDHSTPSFALQMAYDVGSRDEVEGRTGFAHFFEHMMFKGSENVPDGESLQGRARRRRADERVHRQRHHDLLRRAAEPVPRHGAVARVRSPALAGDHRRELREPAQRRQGREGDAHRQRALLEGTAGVLRRCRGRAPATAT